MSQVVIDLIILVCSGFALVGYAKIEGLFLRLCKKKVAKPKRGATMVNNR